MQVGCASYSKNQLVRVGTNNNIEDTCTLFSFSARWCEYFAQSTFFILQRIPWGAGETRIPCFMAQRTPKISQNNRPIGHGWHASHARHLTSYRYVNYARILLHERLQHAGRVDQRRLAVLPRKRARSARARIYLERKFPNPVERCRIKSNSRLNLNDTLQTPNKCDVVTIKVNNKKEKKVKRFLTRSLKETYKVFKNDNPELRIGKSKFYSLRPKYVLLSPIKEVCLCIYCANYDLFLTSLINFRGSNVTELDESRSQIINTTMCSEPSDLCYLQECKICPGIKGITFHVLKLQDVEGT